ncbi:MAG: hypothetical protein HKO58_07030 [Gammaproteobacteria bacterium]|nr:hypothetical protein [Gammaproteobacteria bacterium]
MELTKPLKGMGILLFLLVFIFTSAEVMANKVKKLELSSPQGFDKAPVIKVYSTDGEKWGAIDTNHITKVTANLYARCKWEGKGNKAYKGKFYVTGFTLDGSVDPANFLIPHRKTVSGNYAYHGNDENFNPVKECNNELQKRVAQNGDLKLDEKYRKYPFLEKGFTVKKVSAIRANYHLTCKPTGAGFTDFKDRTTFLNAKIQCLGTPLAKDKIPKPKPKMAKVMLLPDLVNKVSFKPSIANYVGKCPASIDFHGKITATRPGEVKYQYVAKGGGKSPVFTMKFDKAGTKATGKWHETVSKPDKTKSFISKGPKTNAPDVSDWWRLKIVSPKLKKPQASTAKYTVTCQDKPSRAILKR